MSDACPTCDAEMERKSAAGRGRNGQAMGVSWQECDECGTIVDEFGNATTAEEQERAMQEAMETVPSSTGMDQSE